MEKRVTIRHWLITLLHCNAGSLVHSGARGEASGEMHRHACCSRWRMNSCHAAGQRATGSTYYKIIS